MTNWQQNKNEPSFMEDIGMSNKHTPISTHKKALNVLSCKEMQFEINERPLHTIIMAKIENSTSCCQECKAN